MTHFKLALVLHLVATLMSSALCTAEKVQEENDFANPGKIFSEMESAIASGGEVSIEKSMAALKRIVKRVAPEQNGEYQVYQGVSGQPGVDFPALTSIPATSFSCRGMKGGYYADLETNCQVFHICDNSRKISFLCPNGTIFQQSQLICDWWFKVECSKSAEFYDQSSEQLAAEERKRTESRTSKYNYDRSNEKDNSKDYYDVQSLDYDGKQNGRINPSFDELPRQDQLPNNRVKSNRQFEPVFNEYTEGNSRLENYRHSTLHRPAPKFPEEHSDSNKHTTVFPEYRATTKRTQNNYQAIRNSNPREEKVALKRQKFKNVARTQPSSTSGTSPVTANTPKYTESTTFRAGTTPKESQQFAESAAFVSNRGNRFNESPQFYYQLYPNQNEGVGNYNQAEKSESKGVNFEGKGIDNGQSVGNTEPITASTVNYETTGYYWTTTPSPPCHTETQDTLDTVTPNPVEIVPTVGAFDTRDSKSEKFSYTLDTQDRREYTTQSAFPETTDDYYRYNGNRVTGTEFASTTEVPEDYRSTVYPEYEQTSTTEVTNYYAVTDVTSQGLENNFEDRLNPRSPDTNRYIPSQQYRQDNGFAEKSTEKPGRPSTFPYKPYTITEKSLSPYDTSFTYKQGKVMSTLGPYVPFTKNYGAYTTAKPSSSQSNATSFESHSSVKSLIPKLKQSNGKKDHFGGISYLPEKEHALGMLNSLRNLAEESSINNNSTKVTYNSGAPGSSTLHSLALYFSTATDSFDSSETTDSSSFEEIEESKNETEVVEKKSEAIQAIPNGLLTQHTITSYAELFKLNNALESNTTEDRASGYDPDDYSEDLDVQQSSSSMEDQEKSNGTKLRELAQVFTHALSAYLLDPDAFKKVLTEIRPTEPPRTTETPGEWVSTTTDYPTTLEEDSAVTRERDEVLDFAEDDNELAKLRVTNDYPTTNTLPSTIVDTTTTEETSTLPTQTKPPQTRLTTVRGTSTTKVPKEDVTSGNRVGGFQNNTQVTPQARSKNYGVSHRENYISSSTPSPRSHYSSSFGWPRQVTSRKPEQQLTPPFYDNHFRSNQENESVKSRGEVNKSQTREPKQEYPHFLIPPFSSTSSSSIHRGKGINFVINKSEPVSSTPVPSAHKETPNVVPKRDYEPPSSTVEPRKDYEPPYSTTREYEVSPSTVAPLKLIEEPPKFVPSRHYEPPVNEQNYNRVRFFKSSQIASNENDETLVTARTGYAKYRNYNRLDVNTDSSEKKGAKSTTVDGTSYAGTSERDRIKSTTIRSPTEPLSRVTESSFPTTESTIGETTVYTTDREIVTERVKSTPSNGGITNDHWTSSPAVTHLWETSVFIDPKKINHGLESDMTVPSTTVSGTTQRSIRGHGDATHETEFGDSNETYDEPAIDISKDDSNWGWVSKDKDSPTAFTLLPAAYNFESTGTPKPLITTKSSITTTITSSITSTNSIPQENLVASLLPYSQVTQSKLEFNGTENDVAQKLFGKLNATSTNTLMKVMKQADNNETVRQLVLLLVSYCREPSNDTMEEEKDNLLDALLRMPVNQFTSTESRNVISNLEKLTLPAAAARAPTNGTSKVPKSRNSGRMLAEASTYSGFRDRKSRRYRTTTEQTNDYDRTEKELVASDNSLGERDTSAADNRALELLRSLYSIANKWG